MEVADSKGEVPISQYGHYLRAKRLNYRALALAGELMMFSSDSVPDFASPKTAKKMERTFGELSKVLLDFATTLDQWGKVDFHFKKVQEVLLTVGAPVNDAIFAVRFGYFDNVCPERLSEDVYISRFFNSFADFEIGDITSENINSVNSLVRWLHQEMNGYLFGRHFREALELGGFVSEDVEGIFLGLPVADFSGELGNPAFEVVRKIFGQFSRGVKQSLLAYFGQEGRLRNDRQTGGILVTDELVEISLPFGSHYIHVAILCDCEVGDILIEYAGSQWDRDDARNRIAFAESVLKGLGFEIPGGSLGVYFNLEKSYGTGEAFSEGITQIIRFIFALNNLDLDMGRGEVDSAVEAFSRGAVRVLAPDDELDPRGFIEREMNSNLIADVFAQLDGEERMLFFNIMLKDKRAYFSNIASCQREDLRPIFVALVSYGEVTNEDVSELRAVFEDIIEDSSGEKITADFCEDLYSLPSLDEKAKKNLMHFLEIDGIDVRRYDKSKGKLIGTDICTFPCWGDAYAKILCESGEMNWRFATAIMSLYYHEGIRTARECYGRIVEEFGLPAKTKVFAETFVSIWDDRHFFLDRVLNDDEAGSYICDADPEITFDKNLKDFMRGIVNKIREY